MASAKKHRRKPKPPYVSIASSKVNVGRHISAWTAKNPYTKTDYDDQEDVWANTMAGLTIDKKVEFIIGGGIKPTLELIDTKDKSDQQIQAELDKHNDVLDALITLDQRVDFNNTIKDATRMAKVFGRAVIAFEPDGESVDDDEFALKIIHPKDLDKVEINEEDWSLDGVHISRTAGGGFTEAQDMIYIVNMSNNPIKDNLWYGFSELQRVIGAARALRRIVEFDSPEIVQSMWAGYGVILTPTPGMTKSEADSHTNTIASKLKPGAWNVLSKREGMEFHTLDLDPRIQGLVQLMDRYERLIIGNSTIPAGLLGREEEANRATMLGKIQLFISGPIKSEREWLGDIITQQWYRRNLEKLFPQLIEIVRVKAEFEPIVIANWTDSVEALGKLSLAVPGLPPKLLLTLVGLEQFIPELENAQQVVAAQKEEDRKLLQEIGEYLKKVKKK